MVGFAERILKGISSDDAWFEERNVALAATLQA